MKKCSLIGAAILIAAMPSCTSETGDLENESKTVNNFDSLIGDSLVILPQPEYSSTLNIETNEESINDGINDFSLKLFNSAAADGAKVNNGNMSVSPFSAAMCLGLVANAVDSETTSEILKMVGAEDVNQYNSYCNKLMRYLPYTASFDGIENSEMILANSAWLTSKYDFTKSFTNNLNLYYNAEVYKVDFSANGIQSVMDKWCSEKTKGSINELPVEVNPNTDCVLVNALYFKSGWANPFDKTATTKEDFFGYNGKNTVDMMHLTAVLNASIYGDATVVKLPYVFDNYEMVIVMPGEGTDIIEYSQSFDSEKWLKAANINSDGYFALSLPKFIIEQNRDLTSSLSDLGLSLAKIKLTKAGLDNYINMVIKQNSYTGIDEDGTTVAAVTASSSDILNEFGDFTTPTRIVINRPFIYFVRNTKTGSILMAGRVCNL